MEFDSGRKIPCQTEDSNPRQYSAGRFSRTLYPVSYPGPYELKTDNGLKNRQTAELWDRQSDLKIYTLKDGTPDSTTDAHTDSHLQWGRSEQFPAEGPWSRSRHELGRLFRWTANPQLPAKRLPWRQRDRWGWRHSGKQFGSLRLHTHGMGKVFHWITVTINTSHLEHSLPKRQIFYHSLLWKTNTVCLSSPKPSIRINYIYNAPVLVLKTSSKHSTASHQSHI